MIPARAALIHNIAPDLSAHPLQPHRNGSTPGLQPHARTQKNAAQEPRAH